MNKKIFVTKSFLPPIQEFTRHLYAFWDTAILTNAGPFSEKLREDLERFLNVKNLSLVTNGTIGLQIAMKALKLKGEVITTPFSYVATTSSLVWEGLEPVFCDINEETLNIDDANLESLVTEKTSAILGTHVFGNPCDVENIEKIAKRNYLATIYDAAHAFNVLHKGTPVINYGDVSMISFHSTKIFHTIEGGALIAQDSGLSKKINYMRNFGHNGPEEFIGLGVNAKIDELRSAMGLCVLNHIQEHLDKKKEISFCYDSLLFPHHTIRKPLFSPDVTQNYSYYPVIFETEEILKKIVLRLNESNIFPRRYFYPSLSSLPYVKKQKTPIADSVARRILCLPMGYDLREIEIEKISEIILSVLRN